MDSLGQSIENLSLDELDELIDMGREAVSITDLERRLKFQFLSMLASNLRQRFTRTESEEDLDEMVNCLKLARQLASSEDPERIPMNCFLAIILFSRYQSIGGRDLLSEAIEIVETTIPDMVDGHGLQSISSKLRDMYWDRYELDQGVGDLRLAIENTPDTHSQRCYRLFTLSESLHKLHKITKDEEVLAEAILYGEEALTCAGECPNEIQNCHFILGDMQFSKYKVSRDNNDEDQSRNDLDLSVNHLEGAARHAPVGDRNCSPIFVTLGDVLGFRFALTQRREDISRAIENLERGLELMSETDSTLQPTIIRLYFLLFTRYQTVGDHHDLERALYHAERILAISPEQGPYRAGDLYRIGHLHLDLFNATKDDDQLRLAVEYCRNAVSELVAGSDNREVVLFGYATALSVMSERRGDMGLLEEALEKTRMVIDMSQPNDPNRATYLRNNAIMLFRRFRCEGSETDLREATRLAKEVKEHIPRQNPDYAEVLTILCSLQSNSFSLSRNMDDIDEAIRYGQEAIEVQQNKVQEARCLFNLGNALFEKFEKSTLKDDLDAAIDMQLKAVSDVEDPNRPEYLSDLANKLRDRYFMYRDQTDLDAAVERGTLAVELLKPDHPYRAHAEGNLGIILHQVHLVNGSLETLERAISLCESAISTINSKFPRHRDRPRIHNHLGGMRYARFERKGAEEDLNQAVDHGRKALEHAQLTDPAKQIYMVNLAEALRQRFDVFGRLQDVEYAITLCETIVHTTASDHPRRATRLGGLSNMFFSKYNRTFEPEDLDNSIKYGREARSASLPSQPHWAEFCHSLGIFLCTKFQKTGFRNDIEEALKNVLEAVDGTPRHHIQRDMFVASLGSLCHQKYQKFNDDDDLDQAIRYGFEALETAPIHSPRRAMLLFNLARWLGSRSWTGRDENDRELSKRLFLEVLDLDSATVMTRARAGTIIALQCINDEDWQEAYDALQKVIQLLPRISPRTLARGDQQHTLKEFSEVASLAASCALQLGKTDAEALEILESGRGIISGLMINQRNDVSELELVDKDLAARYELLRDRVSQPFTEQDKFTTRTEFLPRVIEANGDLFHDGNFARAEERRAYVRELDALEQHIRKELHGFERFQLSPSKEQMQEMASKHPIVSINASSIRADAFVITSSEIRSIQLSGDTYTRLHAFAKKLIGSEKLSQGLPSTLFARNEELRRNLEWLWMAVVEPILNNLKEDLTRLTPKPFSSNSNSNLPRLLWVTNGVAGLCPLHAAGRHEGKSKDNTASHVISSYVTTLKALSYAKDMKLRPLTQDGQRVVITSMPQTVGQADISADEESEAIQTIFENSKLPKPKVLSLPSKREVLEALKICSIAHFACHGVANPIDPSNGGLLLADAIEPGTPDCLTIHDLIDIHRKNSQIAYLSACSTAENAAESLLDETVHLASTFQLVGFPHVIGTMWEANNKAAVDVARVFYKKLIGFTQQFLDGEDSTDLDGNYAVAFALHEAVRFLKRVKRPGSSFDPAKDVLSWAPFIHVGI